MTFKDLKTRICALLDVDMADAAAGSLYAVIAPLITSTVNAISDKVALAFRSLVKEEALKFEKSAFGARARLPKNFASARAISVGGKRFGGECMEVLGDHIYLLDGDAGEHVLCYVSLAEPFSDAAEETAIPFDDYAADTIAYGAAAELCHSVYPSDMARFMRLATEFDSRMTKTADRLGETSVKNSAFAGKRGGF